MSSTHHRYYGDMQPKLSRVLLWLLIGVLINVAAAWACRYAAYGVPVFTGFDVSNDPDVRKWLATHYAGDKTIDQVSECHSFGFSDLSFHNEYFNWVLSIRDRAGWPMYSLEYQMFVEAPYPTYRFQHAWTSDWLNAALPLRPIWPGFLVNSVLFATPLWLIFDGIRMVRRIVRRRLGLCADCAYPISANPVCTECGASVQGGSMRQRKSTASSCGAPCNSDRTNPLITAADT
jgi:hypothetical protein